MCQSAQCCPQNLGHRQNVNHIFYVVYEKKRGMGWFYIYKLAPIICCFFNSFALQLRQIYCDWYIKPRAISWCHLFVDFMSFKDQERFRDFFRMTPTLFMHICTIVHSEMVTKPPDGLCTLPNARFLYKDRLPLPFGGSTQETRS